MESLRTHPQNALQAKAFTSPASLSFPGGAGDLSTSGPAGSSSYPLQGQDLTSTSAANVVTPATPAATPGGGTGVSGIVPTLQ
jgi:transcription initiation factor TFIID TATA-box-binding protein